MQAICLFHTPSITLDPVIISKRLPEKIDTIVDSRLVDMDFMWAKHPARFNGLYLTCASLLNLHGIAVAAIGYPKSIPVEAIKPTFPTRRRIGDTQR